MFKVTNDEINYLVDKELENALTYAKYHSNHEFYSILKEEIEEADWCNANINVQLDYLWKTVKEDLDEEFDTHLYTIKNNTYNCIKELLQVLAVIKKYEKSKEQ